MIPKKSKKASIERFRFIYFESGLLLTLVIMLVAFEWPVKKESVLLADVSTSHYIPEDIIRTVRKEEPKPPAPPIAPPITIVENTYNYPEEEWTFTVDVGLLDDMPWADISPQDEIAEPTIFVKAQQMPSFQGGNISDFQRYVQSHMSYPRQAIDLELQGRVFVQFVVDENGKLTQSRITRGIDPILDNEVLKVLAQCPDWKAGKQQGRPVKVQFTIPVYFVLQ